MRICPPQLSASRPAAEDLIRHRPRFRLLFINPTQQILVLALLAATLFVSCAQQVTRANHPTLLTLLSREGIARPILLHAESTSVAFDPASRSLLLYRTAGAWLPLDPSHSVALYRESFISARDSAPPIRRYLEDAILNDLLP